MDNNQEPGALPEEELTAGDGPDTPITETTTDGEVVATVDAGADVDQFEPASIEAGDGEMPEEESAFSFPPRDNLRNAEMQNPIFVPMGAKEKWNDDAITLPIPPETYARSRQYLDGLPNMDPTDTVEGAEWVGTLEEGLRHGVYQDFANGAAYRPDAKFTQLPQGAGRVLAAATPKLKDDGSALLTGAKGVLRVNALLGRGSIISIPLWHSGFWITLKAPAEGRLLEMYQRMTEDKIALGRATHGLAFANHSVFIVGAVLDLAMEHIYETSIKEQGSTDDVRSMISALDVPTLAWGLACAIWPRGFQYSRVVLDAKGNANRVIKEKLNVPYLHWLDSASVTQEQLTHMSNRTAGSMSKQSVEIYRDYMKRGKPKTYTLNEHTNITLRVPNSAQYLAAGTSWVNSIVQLIDGALGLQSNLQVRNAHIIDQGKSTSMRQYAHWIQSYEFPEMGDKRIEDEETIASMTDSFSSNDDDRVRFFEVIKEYISDSTMAIIATPIVDESEMKEGDERFPMLLPMDPVACFFTLLAQKVSQIRQRL